MTRLSGPLLRSTSRIPGDLVGRDAEVRSIHQALKEHRLVVVTGPGGIGKTRLAVEAVQRILPDFVGGAWFVALDELAEPGLVGHLVADALDQGAVPARPIDAIAAMVGTASALILLDNCEHVISEATELIVTLLEACPNLRFVATSRELMGVPDEIVVAVPPLPIGDGSAAAELFLRRARSAVPGFAPDAEDRHHVDQICERLDGVPFAIELAAARLLVLSLEDMLRMLDEPLFVLAGGGGTPSRPRGLAGSFEWSYSLCSEDERVAWSRLAIFEGPFTIDAARHVLGSAEALALVQSLVAKALLVTSRQGDSVTFRMFETTRHFGRGLLTEEAALALRQSVLDYAVRFTADAGAAMLSPAQVQWSRRARAEISTIRQALAIGLTSAEGRSSLFVLLDVAFRPVWWANGWTIEVLYWQSRILAAEPGASDTRARALASWGVGADTRHGGAGEVFYAEARAIVGGNDAMLLRILYCEALGSLVGGNFDLALTRAEEGIRATSDSHDKHAYIDFLQVAADASDALGDAARAAQLAEDMRRTVDPFGETWYRTLALRILAINSWRLGNYDAGLMRAREGLGLVRPQEGSTAFAAALQTVALILSSRGEDDERAAVVLGAVDRASALLEVTRRLFAYTGETERVRAGLQDRLGMDAYQRAIARGADASAAEIAALALGTATVESLAPMTNQASRPTVPLLSERESQVAKLVATGATNKAIAAELFLSPRTVEGHVDRILGKLGLSSRTQLAAWVLDHPQ